MEDIHLLSNNSAAPAHAYLSNSSLFIKKDGDDAAVEITPPLIQFAVLNKASLAIRLRDFSAYILAFNEAHIASEYYHALKSSCIDLQTPSVYTLPAFKRPPQSSSSLYDPYGEFARQGLLNNDMWRITHINKSYTLCSTYPALLVVPAKISDNVLNYASRYRSRQRIPTLTYLHWNNRASITRSAQPLVGLKNSRSIQDEKLVESIFTSHVDIEAAYGSTPTNLIIDARPTTNAMAQLANGAGTENMDYYRRSKKVYLGIENIHIIRDSLNKVLEVLRLNDPSGLLKSGSVDRNALHKSGYMKHISAILAGTLTTVKNIHVHSSHVLVHCSDGWDRTSQVVALAQICLDPYYRTLRGLAVLVEKDFIAFGHKFNERCGHFAERAFHYVDEGGELVKDAQHNASNDKFFTFHHSNTSKEISPVFLQFLDCLWQVHRQCPQRFEYNEAFLRVLLREVYSCTSGSFIADSERERRVVDPLDGIHRRPIVECTPSVWDELLSEANVEQFRNDAYDPTLDDRIRGDMGVLMPSPTDLRWWTGIFGEEADGGEEVPAASMEPVEKAADDPVLRGSSSPSRSRTNSTTTLHSQQASSSPHKKSSTSNLTSYFDSWSGRAGGDGGAVTTSSSSSSSTITLPKSTSTQHPPTTTTPSSPRSRSMFAKFTNPISGNMNMNMNMTSVANMARGLGTHVHTHVSNIGAGLASEYANIENRFSGMRVDDEKDDSLPPRLRAGESGSDTNVDTLFDHTESAAIPHKLREQSLTSEQSGDVEKEHGAEKEAQPKPSPHSRQSPSKQIHPPTRIQAPRQAKQGQTQPQTQQTQQPQDTQHSQQKDPLGVAYM